MSNLNPMFEDICKNHGLTSQNPLQEAWDKSVNILAYNKAIDDCLKELSYFMQMFDDDVNEEIEKTLLKLKK